MSATWARTEPFFRRYAWFLLAFVVACFGGKAIFDTADLPPLTPLHHVHALSMGAWFVLFAIQPTLLERGKPTLHRLLGRLSPLLVLCFLASALSMTTLNWTRMGEPLIPTANGINLALFLSFYAAALAWRRHPAAHQRLMLFATLSIIGPAAGRVPEIFDASPFFAAPIVLVLQATPLVHDFVVYRRAHPASWICFAVLCAAIPLIVGLSGSDAWAEVLEGAMGARG